MSTMKRCISLLLVLGILLGVLAPAAHAAPAEDAASVSTDQVTIEGTNGFGNLLSQEIIQSQTDEAEEAEEYPGGYTVTDLEIADGVATVTYDSMEEATLVVALYTEDGMQLLTSAKATVTPDATVATVTFEGEMPEYFMASAYLLDSYDLSPLCAAYDTPMYTREMQELLASTVEDYDSEKVLNLDDDNTTNFAVYADSTIVIEAAEGVNTVASIDDENATYVIKNADEQFTSMVVGNVFVYPYAEGEILIVKVAGLEIDGTTVTITGTELELEEVFSYMKIENTGSTEDMVVDEDSGDDGVAYVGMQENETVNPNAWGDDAELQFSMGFNVEKEIDEYSSFSGSLGIQFDVEFEYYISLRRQFVRFEYGSEIAIKIGYQFQANAPIPKATSKLKLKSFGYSPVAGVYLGFEPEVIVEFTASVEFACTLRTSGGFSYEAGKGYDNLSKKPTVDIDIKFEGVIFFGIDFGPHISILKGSVAKIKLSSQAGLELTGKTTGSLFEDITIAGDDPKEKHDCQLCISVELAVKADFSLKIELLKCDWLTFEAKLAAKRYKIGACYYSETHSDFGWGECPHKLYRLTVVVVDGESNQIANAQVQVGDEQGITNGNGAVMLYLAEDTYTVKATAGELTNSKSISLDDAQKVTLKLIEVPEEDDWIWDMVNPGGNQGAGSVVDNGAVVASGQCGENVYWTLYQSGLLVIMGSGAMTNYDAQESPFYGYRSTITSVVIGENITTIGDWVFHNCDGLTSVVIPDRVTTIGEGAFFHCGGLRSITIGKGVTAIGYEAFYSCDSLTDVIIPDNVTTIADSAFWACMKLSSVTIGNGVTTIGSDAFADCPKLSRVTIGSNVTTINGAFSGCRSLVEIHVDKNNPNYSSDGRCVLFDKKKTKLIWASEAISGSYTIPSSVTIIGSGAFSECSNLTGITIPDSVTTIGSSAFYSCSNLTGITIPDSVTTIGNSAFSSCKNLSNVDIPDSVTTIGEYAFGWCYGLTRVNFIGDAPSIGSNAFANVVVMACYPSGNSTWTSTVKQNYGGTITWFPYTPTNTNTVIAAPTPVAAREPDIQPQAVYGGAYNTEVTEEYTLKTASFQGLVPNEQYVLLAMANIEAEDPLAADNLLYIDQAAAAEDGTLVFQYVQRTPCDLSYVVACGASHKNLKDAEITFPGMVADGELQVVDPVVVYDGVTLTEGRDYVVVGKVDFTKEGEYTCYIRGIHNYTGLVECTYLVKSNPFADVAAEDFYYKPVLWALENDITTGTSDTTFSPYTQCVRAQVVTFLWRAVGSPEPEQTENPFVDVTAEDFYYKPVLWALEQGITTGVDDTHFGPLAQCNRAQVVTFLYRTMGSPAVVGSENPFDDVPADTWFTAPVLWALEQGITTGVDENTFGTYAICNRAQIVTFLYRTYVNQ